MRDRCPLENDKDKENRYSRMEVYTKEAGRRTSTTAMGDSYTQMASATRATSRTTRLMDSAYTTQRTGRGMREIGSMKPSTERESSSIKITPNMKEPTEMGLRAGTVGLIGLTDAHTRVSSRTTCFTARALTYSRTQPTLETGLSLTYDASNSDAWDRIDEVERRSPLYRSVERRSTSWIR